MANWVYIIIAIIFLGIPVLLAIINLIRISTSDKITYIKGNKSITISSGNISAKERKELVNL